MKYLLMLIALSGCVRREPELRPAPLIKYRDTPLGLSVQVIDKCQYVYVETTHGVAIVHKENCNNYEFHNPL